MVNVDIENELYEQIKIIVDKMGIDYPSINNYVNKAVKNQIRIDMIQIKEQK